MAHNREVRGVEPDGDKKWCFLVAGAGDEWERPIHDHFRSAACEGLCKRLSVVPEKCPHVTPTGGRTMSVGGVIGIVGSNREFAGEPLAETRHPRGHEVLSGFSSGPFATEVRAQTSKVPFAKETADVSLAGEELGKTDFLLPEVPDVGSRYPIPKRVASCETASAGRGAYGCTRIKAAETDTRSGHFVQIGGHDGGVAIEPGISPSEVISHAQDEVGAGSLPGESMAAEENDERERAHGDDARVIALEGLTRRVACVPMFGDMNRLLCSLLLLCGISPGQADDWPQWLGEGREATWREEGVVRRLPEGGPEVLWRAPVHTGYSGPAVSRGRVYLMDLIIEEGKIINDAGAQAKLAGRERVLCLDASTGKMLWSHEERRDYEVSYPGGPRATPTVAGNQVFTLGTMGHLTCLTTDGKVQWRKNLTEEYGAPLPMWGHSSPPLVHGELVICMVGGEGSVIVAFDRRTGRETWRALSARHCGYCPLQIVDHEGTKQLIAWHPAGVTGHDPTTGRVFWSVPIKPTNGSAIAMPRKLGNRLFVSGYNRIGGMIEMSSNPPGARILWRSGPIEGVYPVNSTPYLLDGIIYGVDVDRSALMAVEMKSGKRLWESRAPCLSREIADRPRVPRYGTAFLVYHVGNEQFWILGEMGDLIVAELSPQGYQEVSRARVLEPTNTSGARKVLWSHPAFAMRSAFLRNDRELIRVDLAR